MLMIDLKKLRAWRGDRSMDEVVKAIGISKAMYSYIESGERKNVSLDTLEKIARAMDCDPRDLLVWKKGK